MILVARPSDGVSAPYLRIFIVGQIYLLTAMIAVVVGVAVVIVNWPF